MKTEKEYFPALTGIRAVAALMVYFVHANVVPETLPQLWGFFNELHVGVSFFFVLSGLLIGLRYSRKQIHWKKYLVYRVARVYPMWFILTIVTFIFNYNVEGNWLQLLILNLTFLKGFSVQYTFTGIDQGWSLTVEECFYFLAPLLILLLSRKKYLVFILPFVFWGIGLLLNYICNMLHIEAFQNLNFILLYTIFGRAWEFLLGVLFALLYKKYADRIKIIYNRFEMINWLLVFCIIVIIYIMSLVRKPGLLENNSTEGIALNNFVLPVFTVLFYLGLMVKKDIFSKILSSRIMIAGGKASYIFYLIHIGVIRYLISMYADAAFPDNFYRWALKNISLVAAALLMYYFLEEPLNKKVKQFFLGKRQSKSI